MLRALLSPVGRGILLCSTRSSPHRGEAGVRGELFRQTCRSARRICPFQSTAGLNPAFSPHLTYLLRGEEFRYALLAPLPTGERPG